MTIDTSTMKPIRNISNEDLAEIAGRAHSFLSGFSWSLEITEGYLAWGVAGVLGVFLFKQVPSHPHVDDTLWVIAGDLPPAYLVCDDAKDWQAALGCYVDEMEKWVAAVKAGESLDEIIPVNAAPTVENADSLDSRLTFIRREILEAEPDSLESDT